MGMLGAMLDSDNTKLEKLIVENSNHVNDPIGMPFDTPNSHFFGHPIMDQTVIMQHPDQTLFDIACAMPCGPQVWILLAHGAKGSQHPLGTDLALHNAIKNGRPYTVQALLMPGRSAVDGLPGVAWKPLLQAAFWNYPEVVRIILRKGANLEDAAPSPTHGGIHTALQLCLNRRSDEYFKPDVRDRCNQVLRLLLEAGANIHVGLADGSTQSTFELFIKPWKTTMHWASALSVTEVDCLRLFVSEGADLQTKFDGCPCGSMRRLTFEHQVLWHSTPTIARLVVDSFVVLQNSSSILDEIIASCPDAKRHPADTLRDIHSLLQRGVDPNLADVNGKPPLRKCIEQCPAVDLVARLQVLLDGGADPEAEDRDGVQPFVLAARTFEEPLLSEVMQVLVAKMRGNYTRVVDGGSRAWSEKHFPISETQSYQQVMSCSRSTGDFRLEVQDMVPEDVREAFQRAYFAVVSKNFLDTMTRTAKARMMTPRDKDEVIWIIGMRKGIDLPEYRFDQELVVALMDTHPLPETQASALPETPENIEIVVPTTEQIDSAMEDAPTEPDATARGEQTPPQPLPSAPWQGKAPWQFNPNNTKTPSPPQSPKPGNLGDFFFPTTTQIRWMHPDKKAEPGDLEKATAAVLMYTCDVCADGTPLTKNEQEKHKIEHEHTSMCEEVECISRFCVLRKKKETAGCHEYLLFEGGSPIRSSVWHGALG